MSGHVAQPDANNKIQTPEQLVSQLCPMANTVVDGTLTNASRVLEEQKLEHTQVTDIQTSDEDSKDDTSQSSGDATPDTMEGDIINMTTPITKIQVTEDEKISSTRNRLIPAHASQNLPELQRLLKAIRLKLELFFEKKNRCIPKLVISSLAAFETNFCLARDATTNSIWNELQQEQRVLFFSVEEAGIVYKTKCECKAGIPHINDIHCPRNIVHEKKDGDGGDEQEEEEVEETPEQIAAREAAEKKKTEEDLAAIATKARADIDALVGLDELKAHIAKLATRLETAKRQGVAISSERFGTVFIGNSGSGKTTAARLYASYLYGVGLVKSNEVKETSAILLSDGGIDRAQRYIAAAESYGGVFFIDGAHQFMNDNHSRGRRVLDFLLEEIDRVNGKVTFILAGHEKGMRNILGSGTDIAGLLPHVINFKDFQDDELRKLMWDCLKKKGGDKLEVEGGEEGLYMRVAARRVGRGRGASVFGNARTAENVCARIWERQAARLERVRKLAKEAEEKEKAKLEELEKKTKTEEGQKLEQVISEKESDTAIEVPVEVKTATGEKQDEKKEPAVEGSANPDALVHAENPKAGKDTNDVGEVKANEKNSDPAVSDSETEKNETMNKEEPMKSDEPTHDPEDYKLTKEDILGPSPTDALLSSPAWKKLNSLIGLTSVKDSILGLLSLVQNNFSRELQEKPLLSVSLNRLFLGPPGTGKTVVARLYAQILTEIGALSKGEVIMRTPADLIGQYRGFSEANTKAALTAAIGNVLVIDEAYMMYAGPNDGTKSDSFRKAIIDTLVGEVQGVPGEDRCVLLLGYEELMAEMLQNSNPGLARRFPLADAFVFQNFTVEELQSILLLKLRDDEMEATPEAITVAMEVLSKARTRVNFGNGGEVENLISTAKINYQKRVSSIPAPERPQIWVFKPEDFDPAFQRSKSAPGNLKQLFSDVIGCEDIIEKLAQFQRVYRTLKKRGMDPRPFVPTNFIFKGPPGTGKTSTARKMAQIYYDMGFLSQPEILDCSASDLVGQYVGQSGPKTRKLFESALGKVLFVDEAYRLASGSSGSGTGSFNAEVVAELVDLLTKPQFEGKLIVILAGYEKEMNMLLAMNPGLASRFPEEMIFQSLDAEKCLRVLGMKLQAFGIGCNVLEEGIIACKELEAIVEEEGVEKAVVERKAKSQMWENLVQIVGFLMKSPGWGNARDMETLAKGLARDVFARHGAEELDETEDGDEEDDGELLCTADQIAEAMDKTLQERRARRSGR